MPRSELPLPKLDSVDDVIRALGGTRAVMDLTGAKTNQVVTNWRALNRFAANTYVVLTEALRLKGLAAPAALWAMKELPEDALSHAVGSS